MNAKENLLRAIARNAPEYVPYFGGGDFSAAPIQSLSYFGAWAKDYQRGRTRWVDELWGVERQSSGEWEKAPAPVGHPLQSLDDLKGYRFPDPHTPGMFDRVRAEIDKESMLPAGVHPGCLFTRAWTLLGMEGFFAELLLRPDECKQFLRRLADFDIEIAKQYIEAGVEMGLLADDYGWQEALMISPAMWREFIKPELKRIVDVYKSGGCLVQLHSCGCVQDIVSDIVELGIDILNPIQASTNDLPALKAKYGHGICFSGGVDSNETLMLGTPEDVARETRQRIQELGPGGGYIIGPDQSMPFPRENLQALLDTAREYGRYPLKACLSAGAS